MKKSAMFAGIIITLLIGLNVWLLVFLLTPKAKAQEPPKIYRLSKIGDNGIILYKIQDGVCSIYVVEKYRAIAVSTGQGCK